MVTYRVITGGGQFIDSHVSVVMSSQFWDRKGWSHSGDLRDAWSAIWPISLLLD